MEEKRRLEAEELIKKVIREKSFLNLSDEEKKCILDVYSDDMKAASNDYDMYLLLPESKKLVNIVVFVLKEYVANWHVTPAQMKEISQYIQDISKV